MIIAMTVSSIVTTTPWRILGSNRYCPTMLHSKFGFVTTDRTIDAAITSTITAATQRPGRRSGTALMSSGRSGLASNSSEVLTPERQFDGLVRRVAPR